jgi:Undecaprenyl-phosphate glucose phosphotransferase
LNKENQFFLRLCDIVSDVVLTVLAMLLSYFFRFWVFNGEESMPLMFYVRSALLISLLFLLLFSTLGFYESRRNVLVLQVIQHILLVCLGCTAVLATIYFTSRSIDASRILLFLFFLFSSLLFSGKRAIMYRLRRTAYVNGLHVRSVILAGSGRSAGEYQRTLKEMPWIGYQLIGTVGAKPLSAGVPYLGTLEELDDVLRDTSAEELVAALDSDEFDAMDRIVNLTEKYGLKFSLIPYFAPYMISRPYIDQVGSLPLINLRRIPLDNMLNAFVKRTMDILGSLVFILLSSPVMLIAALGTLATLGKPVIFRQTRVGYQRREFTMLKFRSMRAPGPEDDAGWSSYSQDRVTAFGSFLRKTSIDELPQLFNVLRGDMSLVGPRPELPKYVDHFRETVPLYMLKHQVRPGMTGLAQVNGYRGDTSIEERIRLDLRYIETWSFLLDIKILFLTLFHFMNHGEDKHHADAKENERRSAEDGGAKQNRSCDGGGEQEQTDDAGAGGEERQPDSGAEAGREEPQPGAEDGCDEEQQPDCSPEDYAEDD